MLSVVSDVPIDSEVQCRSSLQGCSYGIVCMRAFIVLNVRARVFFKIRYVLELGHCSPNFPVDFATMTIGVWSSSG